MPDPDTLITYIRMYVLIGSAASSRWSEYDWADEVLEKLRPGFLALNEAITRESVPMPVARWLKKDWQHWDRWLLVNEQKITIKE